VDKIAKRLYTDIKFPSKMLNLKSQMLVYDTLSKCLSTEKISALKDFMISWTNNQDNNLGSLIEDLCIFQHIGVVKNETRKEILLKCKDLIQSGTCPRNYLFKLLEYHRIGYLTSKAAEQLTALAA